MQAKFVGGHELHLPPRRSNAVGGGEFAREIAALPQPAREERVWREVSSGNVPSFLRRLVSTPIQATIDGKLVIARIFVAPDYLAVGSDSDYFLMPLTPYTAQRIARRAGCVLPTPKMVDAIYRAASVKLAPSPIPPSPAMTTVAVFEAHNQTVWAQRSTYLASFPLGSLVAGDKKDIVVCKALAANPGHVAIYGWHRLDGAPIQPLYLGHFAYWADYSHGVRLVDATMEIDGRSIPVSRVLSDPRLSAVVSSEGPVPVSRYRFTTFPRPDDSTIHVPPDERLTTFTPAAGVRVVVDEPVPLKPKVRLVLYALPNGNTIEQTFGRRVKSGDDWHYDIQHIGAQTRFLRREDKDESLVVAFLEASNHAWPAWLHGRAAATAVQIVDAVANQYAGHQLRITLDSHSGGGALTFAYINAVEKISPQIDRIAFLDSDYEYDATLHESKLALWLREGGHALCVIAYDDASARLNGKPFVSAEGGTWGRSHAMLVDLRADFPIRRTNLGDPERYEGLDGRITFLLKENPKAEILHTVQVERNGFIESLLSGTALDGRGYRYFGPPAYSRLVRK
ncbi:MAG: hypothetical protein ACYC96_11965 [Fimbriimonadaceae bacterium]